MSLIDVLANPLRLKHTRAARRMRSYVSSLRRAVGRPRRRGRDGPVLADMLQTYAPRSVMARLRARHLMPGQVLVDPDVARQAQHPLAEDVLHDLGGAALDRVRP